MTQRVEKTIGDIRRSLCPVFHEMWERFSFYGMQAIFVFYMINHLHFKQAFASNLFGLYIGVRLLHADHWAARLPIGSWVSAKP